MNLIHRRVAVLTSAAVAAGLVFVAVPGTEGAAAEPLEPAEIALVWQATALTTVPFSPAQGMYLSFTSTAVDRAVGKSLKTASSSEAAAVARAAHDVLAEYFPASAGTLDAKLDESLSDVPDGPAQDAGVAIGAEAAAAVIASRADDGRGDPTIVYSRQPGIGVWADPRPMAVPWYGFVDRIAGGRPVVVDGPDPVGSPAYRADLAEVRDEGRAGADPDKAATATFFNVPAFALYRNALIAHLRAHPLRLQETTDLFADLDRATAEGMRQTWRHKLTEGFWRPTAAITSDDGDPLTQPVPDWTPVLPVPPYPDWPSGHGTLTGAFAETVRCHLGDIPLTLNGAGSRRTYSSLDTLEHDAFMSRIWGGIHFRDAMDDAYLIGHSVARQACG
ncbi:vanadium-dependent haloperoxidase [Nocardioides dilutus]